MYSIKNWSKYQHYGDKKKVPWIKLHYEILTGEDFSDWNNDAKLLAIVCMLVASRHDGNIPDNPKHIQRVGGLDKLPNFKPLIDSGFLIVRHNLNESRQNIESVKDLESESVSSSISISRKGVRGKGQYQEEFEEFWKKYPPNKCSKSEAAKSYNRAIKETDHETIITGVRNYSKFCADSGTGNQYIAHATTWLNQKRWGIDYSLQIVTKASTSQNRKGNFDDVLDAAHRVAHGENIPNVC